MKIEKMDHIGIRVRDSEKAMKFFSELFETEFTKIGEFSEGNVKSWVSFMDPLGIEIVESLKPDGMIGKEMERLGEGVCVVSFKVMDFDEAVKEMETRGLKPKRTGIYYNRKVAIYDSEQTFGVTIELIEYKPQHPLITVWK